MFFADTAFLRFFYSRSWASLVLTSVVSVLLVVLNVKAQAIEVDAARFDGHQASRLQPVLLVRISFSDQVFTFPREDFQKLMFSTDSSVSSVTNYYLENSYGDFLLSPVAESQDVVNDGIVDVVLAGSHPNIGNDYGSASAKLVKEALFAATEYVDFARYDSNSNGSLEASELAIVFMVAGYENAFGGVNAPKPNVWAHQKEISVSVGDVELTRYAMFGEKHQNHLATIGIISHEMGHLLFDLPDLYDRDWQSNGIGRWGLMGLGSWNSAGGLSGSSPAHMVAWSKQKAGFLKPKDIDFNQSQFRLASSSTGPNALRIWLDPFRHGEHFLLEYRSDANFDRGLPGHGLLITHIDDRVGYGKAGSQNDVAERKLVDIEEADGRKDLDNLSNLGDELDVFNDASGQDYFGEQSFPASINNAGNGSGVEIFNIKVTDVVSGLVSLPYQRMKGHLGDNVGYAEGNDFSVLKSADVLENLDDVNAPLVSVVGFNLNDRDGSEINMPWLHGIDIFSPGEGAINLSVYAVFDGASLNSPLLLDLEYSAKIGWNRIEFPAAIFVGNLQEVFVQLVVEAGLSIDKKGFASGKSFVSVGSAGFEASSFDFNQRLLIASYDQNLVSASNDNSHVNNGSELSVNDSSNVSSNGSNGSNGSGIGANVGSSVDASSGAGGAFGVFFIILIGAARFFRH